MLHPAIGCAAGRCGGAILMQIRPNARGFTGNCPRRKLVCDWPGSNLRIAGGPKWSAARPGYPPAGM